MTTNNEFETDELENDGEPKNDLESETSSASGGDGNLEESETDSDVASDVANEDDLIESTEQLDFEDAVEDSLKFNSPEEANELSGYESAEVEDIEFIEDSKLQSILESVLFATDRPVSLDSMKQVFKGTNIKIPQLKKALAQYTIELASSNRGVTLEEIGGGYQLRTKPDNVTYLRRQLKARPFKLSGPAMEVLSIVAYKQPCAKIEIDQIRGVESGHLLRALMDRALVKFGGKSDLPGKPMLYETTRRFLETFGLRNIRELPSPSEIDELIPEGIGEDPSENKKLADLTGELEINSSAQSYTQGEEELVNISHELKAIDTTTEFFEQEAAREKQRRDEAKARDIREALMVGQEVEPKDKRWLDKYEAKLAAEAAALAAASVSPENPTINETINQTINQTVNQTVNYMTSEVAGVDDLAISNSEVTDPMNPESKEANQEI